MAKWFTVGLPLSLGFEPVKHIGRTYMVTPFGEAGLLIVSQNARAGVGFSVGADARLEGHENPMTILPS
jgi:hypothetical protein